MSIIYEIPIGFLENLNMGTPAACFRKKAAGAVERKR